jgi:hypothetical protein
MRAPFALSRFAAALRLPGGKGGLMGIIDRSCVALLLLAAPCATVSAQEFDPGKIRLGQTVVVRDAAGYETKGVVQSVEPSKLVVKYGVGQLPDPAEPRTLLNDRRTFTPAEVSRVQRPAPIWDGAVKGAIIALLPVGILTMSCDCGAPPPGFVAFVGGIGAAIGLGIDAAWGPKTLYRGTRAPRSLAVAPIAANGRRGIAASIRF